jgi:hypothetical protein
VRRRGTCGGRSRYRASAAPGSLIPGGCSLPPGSGDQGDQQRPPAGIPASSSTPPDGTHRPSSCRWMTRYPTVVPDDQAGHAHCVPGQVTRVSRSVQLLAFLSYDSRHCWPGNTLRMASPGLAVVVVDDPGDLWRPRATRGRTATTTSSNAPLACRGLAWLAPQARQARHRSRRPRPGSVPGHPAYGGWMSTARVGVFPRRGRRRCRRRSPG